MLPRLIDSWDALPRASGSFLQERVWFDVKATYDVGRRAEMAKDVAAFANAQGGAIIIGAQEGPTEPDYSRPIPLDYGAKIENGFDEAVRDFCRPSPIVHFRTIPVPACRGSAILVVNVEPSVDQPVAARHETDANMWRFPIRVGRHTEYLLPEQLPLYMNAKVRRAKLLLLRVLDAGGEVDVFTVPAGSTKHANIEGPSHYVIESVDSDGGQSVVIRGLVGDRQGYSATVPIDDVEAIWLQHDNHWAMRLAGRLELFTTYADEATELAYTPPTTFVVSPLGRLVEELSSRVRDIARTLQGTLVVQQHSRTEPSHSAIAERAYQLWALRVSKDIPGTEEEDWSRARQQLLAQMRNQ